MKKTGLLSIAIFFSLLTQAQEPKAFEAYTDTIPGSSISFSMVPIPAGSFLMGSPPSEKGRRADEGPQREVNLSAFWMGAREVTYDEFNLFYRDQNTSTNSDVDAVTRPTAQYIDLSWGMGKEGGFPFNSMSHRTALMYCRWLYKQTGVFYRLPTEAEWEYACRAGSKTAYPFGEDPGELNDYAWSAANSNEKYQKTGQKKPNAWGLYDMLGNLSEWTLDQYTPDYLANLQDGVTDPVTEPGKRYPKTLKGGGFDTPPEQLRSAARFHSESSWNKRDPQIPKSKWWLTDAASIGFRLVSPLQQPSPEAADAFYMKYLKQ